MKSEFRSQMGQRLNSQPFLVWLRLLRVVKKGTDFISPSFLQADLSRAQFDLLVAISIDEGRTQQLYAERMTVTKGNVTQQVQQLEKYGWVRRHKKGRSSHLYLTEAGWQKLTSVLPQHDALMMELFANLTPNEIEQLMRILRKLEQQTK